MSHFLLELRCEEIPARMQAGARAELKRLFERYIQGAGLQLPYFDIYSTPRRLALIVRDLPAITESSNSITKGPPEGAPDQAVDGFCRKNGVTREQLEVRDVKGRATYFAVIEKPGRAVADLLAEAIPAIIRDFAWPKSMRWGAPSISTESPRWVRPLSGIVALFDDAVVECSADSITAGRVTKGHRFHHTGDVEISDADSYVEQLRAAHVIVNHEERQDIIRAEAAKAAQAAGLSLLEDEGLVVENAGLTEWPVPLLGRFDEAYLDVPPEVIQLTARVNQKYFVCQSPSTLQGGGLGGGNPDGAQAIQATQQSTPHPQTPSPKGEGANRLANAFICTANIVAEDGGAAIVDGNRKVLAARLSDARFFWDVDRKKSLEEHAKGLERITFHEKLGTVADKVERVAKLARWLVEEGIVTEKAVRPEPVEGANGASASAPTNSAVTPAKAGVSSDNASGEMPASAGMTDEGLARTNAELADMAEQAARLCKADLVTEMVGEFPELQGLMGGYYARAEGLPVEVADAIRDHYKPVGQGDDVPCAPVTTAVSLADKLDTLISFFASDIQPTGSKDPFALRRATLGTIALMVSNDLRVKLSSALLMLLRSMLAVDGDQPVYTLIDKKGARDERYEWMDNELIDEGQTGVAFRPAFDAYGSPKPFKSMLRPSSFVGDLYDFFADRLKVQQKEAGVRHDLIDAVFALGGEDDLVRLLARVHALQAFMDSEDGSNLHAGYKRAANILKKEGYEPVHAEPIEAQADLSEALRQAQGEREAAPLPYTPEPAEKALHDALDSAQPLAAKAIEGERFEDAMAALASLRAPIDAFFEEVTVNDDDTDKRAARLGMLQRFRTSVHQVADFSKIEG